MWTNLSWIYHVNMDTDYFVKKYVILNNYFGFGSLISAAGRHCLSPIT